MSLLKNICFFFQPPNVTEDFKYKTSCISSKIKLISEKNGYYYFADSNIVDENLEVRYFPARNLAWWKF